MQTHVKFHKFSEPIKLESPSPSGLQYLVSLDLVFLCVFLALFSLIALTRSLFALLFLTYLIIK